MANGTDNCASAMDCAANPENDKMSIHSLPNGFPAPIRGTFTLIPQASTRGEGDAFITPYNTTQTWLANSRHRTTATLANEILLSFFTGPQKQWWLPWLGSPDQITNLPIAYYRQVSQGLSVVFQRTDDLDVATHFYLGSNPPIQLGLQGVDFIPLFPIGTRFAAVLTRAPIIKRGNALQVEFELDYVISWGVYDVGVDDVIILVRANGDELVVGGNQLVTGIIA